MADFFQRWRYSLLSAHGFAIGVIGVSGEAEADYAFVGLLGGGVELGQTGKTANYQRQYAGGGRIKRPEMPHRTLVQNAAYTVDYVVRGQSRGLIDDENGIHRLESIASLPI